MSRGTRRPSEVFKDVLREAQQEVIGASRKAAAFQHRGVRGDERTAALAKFFRERLPDTFGVCKGEAIDYRDNRSGQLDLIVYHKQGCVPVSKQEENMLIPCEGLYCAIEVKSILNQNELEKAFLGAARLRELQPFKGHFVSSRRAGRAAKEGEARCLYILFAYTSNLGADGWLSKEFERAKKAASAVNVPIDAVDRIVVVDRGIINPVNSAGKSVERDDDFVFLEFYLNLVNFMQRELKRRPFIDWQIYSSRNSRGWVTLG